MRLFRALFTIWFCAQASSCAATECELDARIHSATTPTNAVIFEDYAPAQQIMHEEQIRRESVLQLNSRVIQDYIPGETSTVKTQADQATIIKIKSDNAEKDAITLHKTITTEEQYKPSIIRRVGGAIGGGLLSLGKYTIKFTSGTLSAYYLSASTNRIVATSAYSIILWTTGNPVIGKLAYTFIRATPALTTMLVWKTGYEAPTILYYTAYAGWNMINFTTTGMKYTIESLRNILHNKEGTTDLIEMVTLAINEHEANMSQHLKAE